MNCKPIFKTPPILYNFIACLLSLLLFAPIYGQDSGASVFKGFNENQAFTCITVDPNNNIWAGTKKSGLPAGLTIYIFFKPTDENVLIRI